MYEKMKSVSKPVLGSLFISQLIGLNTCFASDTGHYEISANTIQHYVDTKQGYSIPFVGELSIRSTSTKDDWSLRFNSNGRELTLEFPAFRTYFGDLKQEPKYFSDRRKDGDSVISNFDRMETKGALSLLNPSLVIWTFTFNSTLAEDDPQRASALGDIFYSVEDMLREFSRVPNLMEDLRKILRWDVYKDPEAHMAAFFQRRLEHENKITDEEIDEQIHRSTLDASDRARSMLEIGKRLLDTKDGDQLAFRLFEKAAKLAPEGQTLLEYNSRTRSEANQRIADYHRMRNPLFLPADGDTALQRQDKARQKVRETLKAALKVRATPGSKLDELNKATITEILALASRLPLEMSGKDAVDLAVELIELIRQGGPQNPCSSAPSSLSTPTAASLSRFAALRSAFAPKGFNDDDENPSPMRASDANAASETATTVSLTSSVESGARDISATAAASAADNKRAIKSY